MSARLTRSIKGLRLRRDEKCLMFWADSVLSLLRLYLYGPSYRKPPEASPFRSAPAMMYSL